MPAPSPPPAGASVIISDGALAYGCAQAGFAAASIPVMVAICLAESSGQCWAVSAVGDYGLAQINYKDHPDLFSGLPGSLAWASPDQNLKMAASVYNAAGGFSPWVTYTSGAYAAFLARGKIAASAQNKQQYLTAIEAVVAETALPGLETLKGLGPVNTGGVSPLVRVLEVVIGGGLLLLGLYRLTRPATEPIVNTAKTAAKAAAIA
jgi:hypothetical protein